MVDGRLCILQTRYPMITIFLQLLIGSFFQIVGFILQQVDTVMPTEITEAMAGLILYAYYLKDWFPVGDTLAASLAIITITGAKYTIEMGLWLMKFIPWLHPPDNTPGVSREGKGW